MPETTSAASNGAASNTTVDVLDVKGKKAGSVDLPAALFDVQTNIPLIHQVVVAQLAAARQGTHKVKRRGEVSGSGRKPFKQKGTGRARQGSIRAPQMTGGGIVHGPAPRNYDQRTPKKMIAAALLGALSDRARGDRLHVVESLTLGDTPSTKAAVEFIGTVASSKHVLIVLDRDDERSYKSVRNIPTVHVLPFDQLNAYDVLVSDDIIFTKPAFDAFVAAKSASASSASAGSATESSATEKEEVSA
ncbi:MAG: 50S ribosomal protein L4 [Microbacteriaceae bacterium]